MALVQVLEALDRALPPVPSLDQVGTRLGKGPHDHRTQLASLARFKLDDGGMAVLAFPFSAQMVEPFDQGAMRLSMTLFEKLHKVSDEHPGTVQWSVGQEHAPLDLGHNLFSPGTFQDVRTNDLPTVTLPRATAGMTLVRLQEQLMEVTGGHVGIGWLVEAGDVTARNLDALVNDARARLVQAGPAVLGPTSRTPGVR